MRLQKNTTSFPGSGLGIFEREKHIYVRCFKVFKNDHMTHCNFCQLTTYFNNTKKENVRNLDDLEMGVAERDGDWRTHGLGDVRDRPRFRLCCDSKGGENTAEFIRPIETAKQIYQQKKNTAFVCSH